MKCRAFRYGDTGCGDTRVQVPGAGPGGEGGGLCWPLAPRPGFGAASRPLDCPAAPPRGRRRTDRCPPATRPSAPRGLPEEVGGLFPHLFRPQPTTGRVSALDPLQPSVSTPSRASAGPPPAVPTSQSCLPSPAFRRMPALGSPAGSPPKPGLPRSTRAHRSVHAGVKPTPSLASSTPFPGLTPNPWEFAQIL